MSISIFETLKSLWVGNKAADRIVPPSGFTVGLTLFSAAAMAFLAVFALAVALASGRLAQSWGDDLARASTLRISAPDGQQDVQTEAALRILSQTEGVSSARALDDDEVQALLEPWFGPDLPADKLTIPRLIEITQDGRGFDAQGLRLRLQAEVPGAVLDDHASWRTPLVKAATRLRVFGWFSILLISLTIASIVTLAANAALAANAQIIAVLRLVGATDSYIATAFIRRFTLRSLVGASLGTAAGFIAVMLMPSNAEAGAFLTGLGFKGWHWLVPILVPVLTACVAFIATYVASRRVLRRLA